MSGRAERRHGGMRNGWVETPGTRGKITRKCPTCGAYPGQKCGKWFQREGPSAPPDAPKEWKRLKAFHAER